MKTAAASFSGSGIPVPDSLDRSRGRAGQVSPAASQCAEVPGDDRVPHPAGDHDRGVRLLLALRREERQDLRRHGRVRSQLLPGRVRPRDREDADRARHPQAGRPAAGARPATRPSRRFTPATSSVRPARSTSAPSRATPRRRRRRPARSPPTAAATSSTYDPATGKAMNLGMPMPLGDKRLPPGAKEGEGRDRRHRRRGSAA